MLLQKENGYMCWRVTGDLFHSIESCTKGDNQECLSIAKDLECRAGYKITL